MGGMEFTLKANTQSFVSDMQNAENAYKSFAQTAGNSLPIAGPSAQPSVVNGSNGMTTGGQPSTSAAQDFFNRDKNGDLSNAYKELVKAIQENTEAVKSGKNGKKDETGKGNTDSTSSPYVKVAEMLGESIQGISHYYALKRHKGIQELEADPFGAARTDVQQTQNTVGIGINLASGIAAMAGSPVAGVVLKLLGDSVLNAWSENKNSKIEETEAKANLYKQRLAIMELSSFRYGNGLNGAAIQDTLSGYQRDTGVSLDDFMKTSNGLAKYGISTADLAGSLARAATFAGRNTGADTNSIVNYLGMQSRYGKGNAIDNMNYAYSAAMATGLTKNQFGEFLDGLENVIENGISKGYVKSTKEVSDTMVMFDKMSGGNALWKGEQGLQRYTQISSGLANATSLSNSTSLAVYQAMLGAGIGNELDGATKIKGLDALNTFAMMERGLTGKSFNAIKNQFSRIYAGDAQSEVLAWKEFSGLNYNGAMQLYNMAHSGKTVTESTIKQMKANTEYQTEQGRMYNALAGISKSVSSIAQAPFQEYLQLLEEIAGKQTSAVNKIKSDKEKYGEIYDTDLMKNLDDANLEALAEIRSDDTSDQHERYLRAWNKYNSQTAINKTNGVDNFANYKELEYAMYALAVEMRNVRAAYEYEQKAKQKPIVITQTRK